jgi:predicted secreted protein
VEVTDMDRRSRRIVLVAHCILNQNAVVEPLARAPGVLGGIVRICAEAGVGLLQLPCPEVLERGPLRAQAERASYDTAAHRALCRRILEPVRDQVRAYEEAGYAIVGLIGIGHSPSCGVRTTHEGGRPVAGRGVFMEELLAMLPELEERALQVPRDYPDDPEVRHQFEAELRAICK